MARPCRHPGSGQTYESGEWLVSHGSFGKRPHKLHACMRSPGPGIENSCTAGVHSCYVSWKLNESCSRSPSDYYNFTNVFSKTHACTCSTLALWPQNWTWGRNLSSVWSNILPFSEWAEIPLGVFRWTSCNGFQLPVLVSGWSSGPVCMQERWFALALCPLLHFKLNHEEGPLPPTSHLWPPWQPAQGQNLFKNQPTACVPSGPNLWRQWMEDSFLDLLWLLWMACNALWTHQCTHCFPTLYTLWMTFLATCLMFAYWYT